MITSSPEFTMSVLSSESDTVCSLKPSRTKPGSHLHSRKRDKPIRTYGKRSSTTPECRGEPPAKKRKAGQDGSSEEPQQPPTEEEKLEESSTETAQSQSKDQAKATPPSKASILSYFKPLPPPTSKPSFSPESESISAESRLPSSPPAIVQSKRRAPRLLRIRPASFPPTDLEEEDDGEKEDKDEANKENKDPEGRVPRRNTRGTTNTTISKSKNTTTNQQPNTPKDQSTPEPPKPKQAPTVQSTLNITSQAPFSECKVCNTVWNPLYPDDVKYHSKRHAAVTGSKKRQRVDSIL